LGVEQDGDPGVVENADGEVGGLVVVEIACGQRNAAVKAEVVADLNRGPEFGVALAVQSTAADRSVSPTQPLPPWGCDWQLATRQTVHLWMISRVTICASLLKRKGCPDHYRT